MSDTTDTPTESDGSTTGADSEPERSRPSSRPDSRSEEGADGPEIVTEQRRRVTEFVTGIVAALGVWVAVSVLLYEIGGTALGNTVAVGALVALGAGYNYYRQYEDTPSSLAVSGVVAALGLWLVASAGVFELTGGAFLTATASGALIAGLAGYNVYEARNARDAASGEA